MKYLGAIFVLVIIAAFALPTEHATAEPMQVSGGQIRVLARVLPTHYIIVDHQGIITEIASNTDGPATPRVFLTDVALGQEQPYTSAVQEQYETLVPNGLGHIGILYRYSSLLPLFNRQPVPTKNPILLLND
jgi:hypothetical protein